MNTAQIAAELKVESKLLRRFLRAVEPYNQDGAYRAEDGKTYLFSADDVAPMRERFIAWAGDKAAKPASKPRTKAADDSDDMATQRLSRKILGRKLYASERTRRDAISRARVDKLEAALLEKGLHISQMKDLVKR